MHFVVPSYSRLQNFTRNLSCFESASLVSILLLPLWPGFESARSPFRFATSLYIHMTKQLYALPSSGTLRGGGTMNHHCISYTAALHDRLEYRFCLFGGICHSGKHIGDIACLYITQHAISSTCVGGTFPGVQKHTMECETTMTPALFRNRWRRKVDPTFQNSCK